MVIVCARMCCWFPLPRVSLLFFDRHPVQNLRVKLRMRIPSDLIGKTIAKEGKHMCFSSASTHTHTHRHTDDGDSGACCCYDLWLDKKTHMENDGLFLELKVFVPIWNERKKKHKFFSGFYIFQCTALVCSMGDANGCDEKYKHQNVNNRERQRKGERMGKVSSRM